MPARLAVLLVLVLACAACGGGDDDEGQADNGAANAPAETCEVGGDESKAPDLTQLDPARTHRLTFETNKGSFTVELDVEQSPCATASMAGLARKGFFDGTVFHRIVPDFVIQGGDPQGTGTGGPGYSTVDTPPQDARYTKGVVAMAKTATEPAGTAGSQFFVVTGDDVQLTPDYAIIGEVTDGLDVVEEIGTLGDPGTQQPTERVTIERATVESS